MNRNLVIYLPKTSIDGINSRLDTIKEIISI